MPNWCENTLSIKGTKEQIVDFNKRYLPNGTFSFENVIPSPQTIEECPEDYILHNEEEANKHCLLWNPTQPRNCEIGETFDDIETALEDNGIL